MSPEGHRGGLGKSLSHGPGQLSSSLFPEELDDSE